MTAKIKDTIVTSNETHLNEICLDFEESKTRLSQEVYSIFVNPTMQQLLYGQEIGFDALSELQSIDHTVSGFDPSIYCVGFYNTTLNQYYSTIGTAKDNSLSFVSQQESIDKLSPIFRKAEYSYATEEEIYLLSYIMYEYRMPEGDPSSFVIVNQDVGYLLNELRASSYAENTLADVFLFSGEYGVCGTTNNIAEEDMDAFTAAFTANRKAGEDRGTMTIRVGGKEYLVSWSSLTKDTVDVVILQPKNIVFASLSEIHTRFLIILIIGMIVYLIVIYFLSKSLYKPVEMLSEHIQEIADSDVFIKETNEFEQFKAVYSSFSTMKKKYYLRYLEDQLLTNSSTSVVSAFAGAFSGHWLLTEKQFVVVQLLTEHPTASGLNEERDLALDLYAVQNIAEELLGESFCVEAVPIDSTHLAVILGSDGNWGPLNARLNKLQKSIDHFFDFSISALCSEPVMNLEELDYAYQQTCNMEGYAPIFGRGKILSPDMLEENLNNPAISYPQPLLNALTMALTSRNADKIHKALQSLCSETKRLSVQNLWFCISLLINHIRNVIQELSAGTAVQTSGVMKQLTRIMNEFTTVDCFFAELERIVTAAVCDELHESGDKNTVFLRSIEAYVAEHYQDSQLSAQQIADHLDVSANYLPRKFQSLSGMSLSNYILQVRMQHAAKLLQDNKLSIFEIALLVGIENESYFYKLFKKYYGCTPKEFKSRQ